MQQLEKTNQNINSLLVIDKFEIGPVKLEKKRFLSPYKITQNGEEHSIDLIYRYEEEVFDPKGQGSKNLADMVAVQVALNYGLFCKEIVFHGSFDKYDQQFIKDMMENTSREIYVKKFLEPNPFLQGAAASLAITKLDHYTQAIINFNSEQKSRTEKSNHWEIDRKIHAILSSGGKDCLPRKVIKSSGRLSTNQQHSVL